MCEQKYSLESIHSDLIALTLLRRDTELDHPDFERRYRAYDRYGPSFSLVVGEYECKEVELWERVHALRCKVNGFFVSYADKEKSYGLFPRALYPRLGN